MADWPSFKSAVAVNLDATKAAASAGRSAFKGTQVVKNIPWRSANTMTVRDLTTGRVGCYLPCSNEGTICLMPIQEPSGDDSKQVE